MDIQQLKHVLEQTGPFLTLDLDVGRAGEDAEARADARATRVRHFLQDHAVDEALAQDLEQRVRENTHLPGEVRRTIVVAPEGPGVVLDDVRGGHESEPEVLELAVLPDLTAWVDHHDQTYPFVLALVDRTGADLAVHRALSTPPSDQETVTGHTYYIRKVPQGDWAHTQFQQTAEDRWVANARLVADTVHSLAREHHTRAVLVAGEVRARAEVLRALGTADAQHLGTLVEIESGGRAEGSSQDALWSEVEERVRALVAERDNDLVARLEEARGRGEGAATGLDEVLSALAMSRVDTVLADLGALSELTVDPRKHEGLPLPGQAADATELPADRVVLAAAALTGAHVSAVPASLARGGGVSALLRWAEDGPGAGA